MDKTYAACVTIEKDGLAIAKEVITAVWGKTTRCITDDLANWLCGDLLILELWKSVEVKHQGIDPAKHRMNWIEVVQINNSKDPGRRERNSHGQSLLAAFLGMTRADLESLPVKDHRDGSSQQMFGFYPLLSVPVSTFSADAVFYVNPDRGDGTAFVYIYAQQLLRQAVRKAVRASGLHRAPGLANENTFGVFVPHLGLATVYARPLGKPWKLMQL